MIETFFRLPSLELECRSALRTTPRIVDWEPDHEGEEAGSIDYVAYQQVLPRDSRLLPSLRQAGHIVKKCEMPAHTHNYEVSAILPSPLVTPAAVAVGISPRLPPLGEGCCATCLSLEVAFTTLRFAISPAKQIILTSRLRISMNDVGAPRVR